MWLRGRGAAQRHGTPHSTSLLLPKGPEEGKAPGRGKKKKRNTALTSKSSTVLAGCLSLAFLPPIMVVEIARDCSRVAEESCQQ